MLSIASLPHSSLREWDFRFLCKAIVELKGRTELDYTNTAISDAEVPRASVPMFQHLLKTYASEVNKLNSVWLGFTVDDLDFKPHERSSTVGEIMKHELLSQRRFFGEF